MYDLKGITFLTFVRLDNQERKNNLKAMHSFYRNRCENYQHIFKICSTSNSKNGNQ